MSWQAQPATDPPVPFDTRVSPERQGLDAERVGRELAYVALGLALGVAYLLLVIGGVVVGVLLGALWIGLPLLVGTVGLLWRCAALERDLANRLLGAEISPLPPLPTAGNARLLQRIRHRLSSRAFWRAVTLLTLRLPGSVAAAALIGAGLAATVVLLVLGVGTIAGARSGYIGPLSTTPVLGVVLCLLAVPFAVVTIAFVDWAAIALRALARAFLITSLPAGAPVRETLATSLGDRTLWIAYWLPDRETYVDERGNTVPLPEMGSGRSWTAVDYEGQRVAAIIHDPSLEASPELVQAATAGASLALDNERLKADLRARVQELRASRARLVEASNAARRQIERDLHDGAQQQLVAMAVELRLLRTRVAANDAATELIDRIDAKLSTALGELRELARGIHPGILTDRGLSPALESLASRAPIAIEREIDLPSRPPASVEAVAYFVIAEALTNVLKYSGATKATLRAHYDGDDVVVEMEDNGAGGADPARGTGLQGLRDRVGALDGTLTVVSPAGDGTRVSARIPCRPA
jgi:signal transduction histidine kinase